MYHFVCKKIVKKGTRLSFYDIFNVVIIMITITNKKRCGFFIGVSILLLIFLICFIIHILKKETPLNLDSAMRGIICEDNIILAYEKKNSLTLNTGDLVYILQDNYLSDTYTISYEGHVGDISKNKIQHYDFHSNEKYSLMVDVSEFNMRDNFSTSGEFALFVINHGINYVYMRLGGRGYGEKGNMYYDASADDYIEVCDFLKIPYGFYYLDEALNEEEILEEVAFVKTFFEARTTQMNYLPLAIDLEFQEGAGRADHIWNERTPLLEKLMEEFQKEGISCILYANAKRANDYLSSLDTDFWIARYPQNGIIPNSTFAEFITLEQTTSFLNSILDKNNKIKSSANAEYKNTYSGDFLNKIIGWQFTADGASKDGIDESIDLSIVNNAFFQKYLTK